MSRMNVSTSIPSSEMVNHAIIAICASQAAALGPQLVPTPVRLTNGGVHACKHRRIPRAQETMFEWLTPNKATTSTNINALLDLFER
mmetsp:Transcript_25743/g.54402  ORF Transcript_25743/g.54402 Transcript_25743/m.54402 type:complete len:87 (-) Transcript_25743:98-358(-)